jgi:phosphoglycolate phosphatase
MRKKLIIFDIDGTLIHSREDLANAINLMLNDYGIEQLPLKEITGFIGNGAKALVKRSLGEHIIDIDEALACYQKHYSEHIVEKTFLYSGVRDGIKKMVDAGCTLAVVTNKPEIATKKILNILGVDVCFKYILGGGGDFPLKPEPDNLLYLLSDTGIEKSKTVMVGDHYTDLEVGRRAGVERVLVEYGFGDPKDETPDYTMETFEELVDFVLGDA